MKGLGVADEILNIKWLKDGDGGITLFRSHCVDKILSHFGYSDYKLSPTQYDPTYDRIEGLLEISWNILKLLACFCI
jgi:hypothetical protein